LPAENYGESFKIDILLFIDAFEESNPRLSFLNDLETFEAIEAWVTRLTSRIVMKYDEVFEPINDFIYDFILLG
jgi:hypothetical protein